MTNSKANPTILIFNDPIKVEFLLDGEKSKNTNLRQIEEVALCERHMPGVMLNVLEVLVKVLTPVKGSNCKNEHLACPLSIIYIVFAITVWPSTWTSYGQ